MKVTFRVTLIQLTADATAVEPPDHTPRELGELAPAAIEPLLVNLSGIAPTARIDADPAILLRRHGRGWRVTPGTKSLMLYDGLEPLSPSFPLDPAGIIAALDPARDPATPATEESAAAADTAAPDRRRLSLSPNQAIALLVAGLVLLGAGLWFGLHTEDINAVPGDVVILTAPADVTAAFTAVAGQYLTPVSPGNGVITLTSTGHFSFATMGPDGHPLPTTYEEEARAGTRAGKPCVVTTVGIIEIVDRDTLRYNDIQWRRTTARP